MKYWTRTTHNFNNETREWEFRGSLDPDKGLNSLVGFESKSCIGVHALYSGRWQTLGEIVAENERYYEQYKNDPYGAADKNGCTEEAVLHDLEFMESLGLVKSREL